MKFLLGHGSRTEPSYEVEDRGYITPCWITKRWIVKRDGRRIYTYRYMWELKNGPIPKGLELDHLCGQGLDKRNPESFCIRPEHLEPVTIAENCRRGRQSKLTKEQVLEIRTIGSRYTGERIATQFGISASQVYRILSREQWADV